MRNKTYNKIIEYLEAFATEHYDVKRFAEEDEDQMSNITSKDEKFPMMFVTPIDTSFGYDMNDYALRIYCYDRLTKDRTNSQNIRSKTNQILNDLDVWMRKESSLPFEVTETTRARPYSSELMTDVTGWYIEVTIDSPSFSVCEIPFARLPEVTADCNQEPVDMYGDFATTIIKDSEGGLLQKRITPCNSTSEYTVSDSDVSIGDHNFQVKATDSLSIELVNPEGSPLITELVGGKIVIYDSGNFLISIPNNTGLNRENVIDITSSEFNITTSYTNTDYAYYLLERNLSDEFENFVNGSVEGNPGFRKVNNLPMLDLNGVDQYFKADTNDSRGLVGNSGNSNYTVGIWTYLEDIPTQDEWVWIAESGNGEKTGLKYDSTLNEYSFVRGSYELPTGVQVESGKVDRVYARYNFDESGSIDLFIDGDIVATGNMAQALNFSPTSEPILIGTDLNNTSYIKGLFNHFRTTSEVLSDEEIFNLSIYKQLSVQLKSKTNGTIIDIPDGWVSPIKGDTISFTIPTDTPFDEYSLEVVDKSGTVSNSRNIVVEDLRMMEDFVEDFSDIEGFRSRFEALHKQWGGDNGGVVEDNIWVQELGGENVLVLKANGDLYTGSTQGVDSLGNPAFDEFGDPITKRVGGCIVSKDYTGFGSFEFTAKPSKRLGVASAFWNFHYQEVYESDPRWERYTSDYIVQGTPQVGLASQFNFENDSLLNSAGTDTANVILTDTANTEFISGIKQVPESTGKVIHYVGSEGYAMDLMGASNITDLSDDFTVSFHIKINTDSSTGKRHNILTQGNGKNSIGVQVLYTAEGPQFQSAIRTDSENAVIINNNQGEYGEWHHIAIALDNSDVGNEFKFYMDGTLRDSMPKPGGAFNASTWWRAIQSSAISGTSAGFAVKDWEITDIRINTSMAHSQKEIGVLYGRPYEIGNLDMRNLNLAISGDEVNGYYCVRNNEIDIEVPSHLEGGDIEDPSTLNAKFNTWRGELQNYSLLDDKDNYEYWEEVRDNYRPMGIDINDNQYHKFRYDYYHDKVEFYVDDILIETNYDFMYGWNSYNIPETAMKITLGLWFPSGGNKWAGPNADFESTLMLVKEIKFTNFTEENDKYLVKVGESFPFDGTKELD